METHDPPNLGGLLIYLPLPRLLSSLWVSRTGSASDWCALQEVLYKCIDTIQYNTLPSWFTHKGYCIAFVHLYSASLSMSLSETLPARTRWCEHTTNKHSAQTYWTIFQEARGLE